MDKQAQKEQLHARARVDALFASSGRGVPRKLLMAGLPQRAGRLIRGGSPPPLAQPWRTADPGAVTDDGARRDGGNTTEDEPVSQKKMNELGHSAIEHTADESGS